MKSKSLKENKDFRRLYYSARRVIRAAFSQLEGRICANCDIVFVARTSTCEVKMQDVLADMEKQLIQLGVIE